MSKTLTLRVSDDLAARIDAHAARRQMTRTGWMIAAMDRQMRDEEAPRSRRAPSPEMVAKPARAVARAREVNPRFKKGV